MNLEKAELTFSLVDGEAEEKFLLKAVADMKERRSKSFKNKGGRGKQQFTRKRTRNDERNDRAKHAKVDGD